MSLIKILQYHAAKFDDQDNGVLSNLMFTAGFPKFSLPFGEPFGNNLNIQSKFWFYFYTIL